MCAFVCVWATKRKETGEFHLWIERTTIGNGDKQSSRRRRWPTREVRWFRFISLRTTVLADYLLLLLSFLFCSFFSVISMYSLVASLYAITRAFELCHHLTFVSLLCLCECVCVCVSVSGRANRSSRPTDLSYVDVDCVASSSDDESHRERESPIIVSTSITSNWSSSIDIQCVHIWLLYSAIVSVGIMNSFEDENYY